MPSLGLTHRLQSNVLIVFYFQWRNDRSIVIWRMQILTWNSFKFCSSECSSHLAQYVKYTERAERSSWLILLRSFLNLKTLLLTIQYDERESFSVLSIFFFIWYNPFNKDILKQHVFEIFHFCKNVKSILIRRLPTEYFIVQ